MRNLFRALVPCMIIVVLFSVSTSAFASGTNKASSARTQEQTHSLTTAKTLLADNQLFISSKVVSGPKHFPPPPTDCITLWGGASNIQKFGVVASYNVRANLWNTCGVSLKGTNSDSSSGWNAVIYIECEGAWIEQGTVGGRLPDLSKGQQLLPLFYYNFKSTCVAADGFESLPQHIEVDVAASAVRTDNDTGVTGGVTITVY